MLAGNCSTYEDRMAQLNIKHLATWETEMEHRHRLVMVLAQQFNVPRFHQSNLEWPSKVDQAVGTPETLRGYRAE